MSDAGRTTLTVCRTCRPEGADAGAEPLGAELGRAAAEALRRHDRRARVEIRSIACLSACKRACSASIAAEGKFAYVIGGLEPRDAEDLVGFALAHADAEDGVPPWRARPEKIRKNTIARVAPPGRDHPLMEDIAEEDVILHR